MTSEELREDMERRDRKAWEKSEYSKKGTFYISYAKWKRLSSRMCRTKATITFYSPTGYHSQLKLNSAHNDSIGMSRKSLEKWIRTWIIPKRNPKRLRYHIEKWSINAA